MDKGGVRDRVRQWGKLLAPLMIVLMKWVDSMSLVFQSRGLDFSARKKRTRLRVLRFGPTDAVLTVALVAGIVLVLYASRTGRLATVGE